MKDDEVTSFMWEEIRQREITEFRKLWSIARLGTNKKLPEDHAEFPRHMTMAEWDEEFERHKRNPERLERMAKRE